MLPAISPAVISHLAMPNSGVRRYAAALQSLVSAGARDRLARAEEPVVRRLCAGGDSLERTRLWRPIPCYTGKYRELRQIRGSATDQTVQIGRKTRGLQRSSLCRLTGNFLRPNRDLNRAIRVIFGLIRELGAGAPAPDLAGASAKKRTAHVFPKGPDEFTRAAQLALGS